MKTNEELLAEANEIEFIFTKNGRVNPARHTKYELGLYTIKRAIEVHGMEKYSYGKLNYVNATTKTTVVCPLHGDFAVAPANLTRGRGCPKCNPKFFSSSKSAPYYDWHEESYTRELEVSCSEAQSFLFRTASYTEQMYESELKRIEYQKKNDQKERFIKRAKDLHKEKYDYSQVSYKNAREKVQILCQKHGPFYQTPDSHLSGRGCPKCGHHNHNILYLLKCKETGWYKIGITTGDTKRRIQQIGAMLKTFFTLI